ncbi:hypothetical protein V7O66_02680 [Methanolobus sp. ZRKC3]
MVPDRINNAVDNHITVEDIAFKCTLMPGERFLNKTAFPHVCNLRRHIVSFQQIEEWFVEKIDHFTYFVDVFTELFLGGDPKR